jgi:glutamate/aspartate transport system ATP-binding protein
MISIDNVSKHYGSFQVLTDCTTQVKKGEVIVVCGPSGSGKSTLIKCVNGLEPFQAGTITVNGVRWATRRPTCPSCAAGHGVPALRAVPPHEHHRQPDHRPAEGARPRKDEATDKGLKLLERVGLKAHAHKFPASSRAASSSAWRSPGRWRWTRSACSSTSPPRPSTPR